MPDPIRKRYSYGQFGPVTASMQPGSGRIVYLPDPTSSIRFSSVLQKKARVVLYKTDPDPIWMARSGFGQTHLFRNQAGVLAERNWFATSVPFSDSVAFFHKRPGSHCATSARIRSGSGCLSVRFGSNGSGPEASRKCKNHQVRFWPTRIGFGLFTGIVQFVWQRE